MAAVRHLGFVVRMLGPPTKAIWHGLCQGAKFGWNRLSSFHNMHVFRFREFGWKTPIRDPKLFFGGRGVDPMNGKPYQKPKRHILA